MRRTFRLAGRTVGAEGPCFIIAEVAQAHDGSLGTAHAFIDAVADSGADAVKFQTHIAAAESTSREPFRVRFSQQDATRYDYWKRMEFTEAQWHGLAKHAGDRGLVFLSSPFSIEAVELLERVGVPAWKIPSGEIANVPLLERVLATGLPILLSTGMSPLAEIDAAIELLGDCDVLVFQSTSEYPCPPERLGLDMLPALRRRYGCPVGLSDHSGTIFAGLGAVSLGIDALEVHVTFSRSMFGPDAKASLTIEDLSQLVEGIRFLERARGSGYDKDAAAHLLAPVREAFGRSIVAARDLPRGTVLALADLACKKPAGGIPPVRLRNLVGRRLDRPIERDDLILDADLVP